MRRPLTLYALKSSVADFDDAVRQQALDEPSLERFDLPADFDFGARLYLMPVEPSEPSWAEFLREGFADFEAAPSAMNRVVVVLRVAIAGEDRFFAATFGNGRFLLRPDAFVKKYGLRVALNAIYEGDGPDSLVPSERLRQVATTRVAKNTIHTRRQSNRDAAFQDFGVDLESDLLGAVTGVPGDGAQWGSRVGGSDSLRVQIVERFAQMGALCRQLFETSREKDYEIRFSSIDDIRSVPPEETAALEEQLLEVLRQSPETVTLAPPALLDFDRVSTFRFSLDRQESFDDLRLVDYLSLLRAGELEVTLERLKSDRVEALDDQEEGSQSWSVFETLDTELAAGDRTFLLVGGSFFGVAAEVMAELNRFVDALEESDVDLPPSTFETVVDPDTDKEKVKEESEGDYNERTAASSDDFFLLDKETVRIQSQADPIEVCDVLTTKRQFVHVKRKFSSSSLSHLFAQGAVSGDLFVRSDQYREKIRQKLDAAPRFEALIPQARPDTAAYEVVYAIIGKWEGAEPSVKLPFFSKVNLRRHVENLRAAGFQVTYKKIELVPV